jgi:D-alanyl-D-alanine carboxypeptidase/D-alanyl-D-alanine-endopeptidase (penicillin-binding protein 4)
MWTNLLNDSYILNSKALAGYIDAPNGKKLAFAIFLNNMPFQENANGISAGKTLAKIAEQIFLAN